MYLCKIASLEEMNQKWDYEISHRVEDRENWIIWKRQALENFQRGDSLPYYGILDGTVICEATAMQNPEIVQNAEGLVGNGTVYLCAFRTIEEYRGRGYFARLMRFMLEDLRQRGIVRVTLGVEPAEETNRSIYAHFGFDEYIKSAVETYPDGTAIDVDYYGMEL